MGIPRNIMSESHLFHLIANEMLWKRRKVNILKLVARIMSDRTVCKSTGLVMCGVVPPLSHMPSWSGQGQLNVNIYQTVETLPWYILMCYFCDFLSLHSLGTWNSFASSSSQNTVILKIMFVSLLFDMVLCCLTYQVLSCFKFVATVTETDGQ